MWGVLIEKRERQNDAISNLLEFELVTVRVCSLSVANFYKLGLL